MRLKRRPEQTRQGLVSLSKDLGRCEGKALRTLSKSMTHTQEEIDNLDNTLSTIEIEFKIGRASCRERV